MKISKIVKDSFLLFLSKFFDLLIALVVIAVVRSIITGILIRILGIGSYSQEYLTSNFIFNYEIGGYDFYFSLVNEFVVNVFLGANYLALLELIRGGDYSIGLVFEKLKEYYPQIIVLSLIYSIIISALKLVPILGSIVAIIAQVAFAYIYFLIEDMENEGIVDHFRLSYELTNGHKINLFLMTLIYKLIPIVIIFVVTIFTMPLIILSLGLLGFPLVIGYIILSSSISIMTSIGLSLYYDYSNSNIY